MATKDDEILSAWAEFFVSHALAVREIERDMASKAPLTLDEYDVLLVISRSPDGQLRFSAIAEATVYTRSGITRIVKRLEEAGYLEKKECPDDKRGSLAALTEKGRKAMRETWRWYSAAVLKVFSPCFTRSEALQLQQLLARITGQLSSDSLVRIRSRVAH